MTVSSGCRRPTDSRKAEVRLPRPEASTTRSAGSVSLFPSPFSKWIAATPAPSDVGTIGNAATIVGLFFVFGVHDAFVCAGEAMRGLFDRIFLDVGHDHVGARLGQRRRDTEPDAGSGTGDDRGF